MQSKSLKGRDQHLALSLQGFRKSIFLSIPKGVYGMVGIDKEILFGEMEIIEVISLEDGLDFTIFVLFCFSVLIPVGLDNSCMALVLA